MHVSLTLADLAFLHTSSTQKSFLSWQSKIAVTGTYNLSYLHGGFYNLGPIRDRCIWLQSILQSVLSDLSNLLYSPLCLSGFEVESLFSQYKHNPGGKLDSVNYTITRAAHLIKQSVSEHHSGNGYRNEAWKQQFHCVKIQ